MQGKKKRREGASCWVRCSPGGLALSLHVAWFFVLGRYYTPTVRMWLPVSCFAFIIIYVFSRNITYDHCLKYWSNYVLEIKDLIKLMVIRGEQRFHFREFCVTMIPPPSLTSCYKHGSVVLDEVCTPVVICGFIETCLSRMFSRPVSIEMIRMCKCLRWFASRWTYIRLPFFQIHEKLHYYEKQNPVPILQGAAALADDVSVPSQLRGTGPPRPPGQDSS